MRHQHWVMPRRTFLRGLGTAIPLPLLGAMLPTLARAAAPSGPVRYVFVYQIIGMVKDGWKPATVGKNFELNSSLSSLAALKNDLTIVSGLNLTGADAGDDGPGDHARAGGVILTGNRITKASDRFVASVSIDQLLAAQVGKTTKLASLPIGVYPGGGTGNCDSGYACAYTSNISWINPTTPAPRDSDPVAIFNRLFAGADPQANAQQIASRQRLKKSILDFALADATSLRARLGKSDQQLLDGYLSSVRESEKRLGAVGATQPACTNAKAPTPATSYPDKLKLLYDLMALALQCDATRVITLLTENEGDNASYNWAGVSDGLHTLSHNDANDQGNLAKLRMVDKWRIDQYAAFVTKLKATQDGFGNSLLSSSVVVTTCGVNLFDHTHRDLPFIIAGQGSGTIASGQHIQTNEPMANAYLALLLSSGANATKFADSTAPLTKILT